MAGEKDLGDELRPHPEHPIFNWAWYELPSPLTGYLVIPAHVPFPGDPIEWGENPEPIAPPSRDEVEANS